MGVPKFFRWLSERYPKIIQRYGSRPVESTCWEHLQRAPPTGLPPPDPMSECTLPPMIDRLYIDMNGIIHGCSHNNQPTSDSDENDGEGVNHISEEEIFRNVTYYVDRIVKEVARPTELVYLAIDGVAPRAKLNQQRARRYRSGKEGEIERTVYDAHREAMLRERRLQAGRAEDPEGTMTMADYYALNNQDDDVEGINGDDAGDADPSIQPLQEVEPGRFSGKFETELGDDDLLPTATDTDDDGQSQQVFHSNAITPGTAFFQRCSNHLEQFIRNKLSTDPAWKDLTIIFSGPNAPGEGEHKIMQFIREQKSLPTYNPNLRHCIMSQDGDLIMLGLVTHEPNLVLLRQQVVFDSKRRVWETLTLTYGLDTFLHNPNFEFLHMNILRDYLAYEFTTSNVLDGSNFELEQTIDDFVFLTFFIGNDFLPSLPAIDIADEAFDLLFYIYRHQRENWMEDKGKPPYLTRAGSIVSGRRLEEFLRVVGSHESQYYDYKKSSEESGQFGSGPSEALVAAKEESDRAKFRDMITTVEAGVDSEVHPNFTPVLSSGFHAKKEEKEEEVHFERLGNLLQFSVAIPRASDGTLLINDQDFKGRYYHDKFGFSPFDAGKHMALRKAYIEGLVWNLKYYYEGVPSWTWFYPYHYAPMMSDLRDIDDLLGNISFQYGEPFKPFVQLMACLPPSHAHLLPKPYRGLMTEQTSPVAEFYPRTFTVDMNGKRWPWEAVVLLPFIDAERLLESYHSIDQASVDVDERKRNEFCDAMVFSCSPETAEQEPISDSSQVAGVPYQESKWRSAGSDTVLLFKPELSLGAQVPLSGLPTLRDGLVQGLWRKMLRINVHGRGSRYKTACLELENRMPEILSIELLAPQVVGKVIYINYPHLTEAFVTAVSDSFFIIRGNSDQRKWSSQEAYSRKERMSRLVNQYVYGERLPGTGGITMLGDQESMRQLEILLHVRPFSGIEKTADGTQAKKFAKFEIEVPIFVLSWAPRLADPRLHGRPLKLEKDPYKAVLLSNNAVGDVNDSAQKKSYIPLEGFRGYSLGRSPQRLAMRSIRQFHSLEGPVMVTSPPYLSCCATTLNPLASTKSIHATERTKLSDSLRRVQPRFGSWRGRWVVFGLAATALASLSSTKASQSSLGTLSHSNALDSFRDFREPKFPSTQRVTPPLEYAHGTTTVSFQFSGGIIVAVDSRASMGNFVGSKSTQKVLPINSHVLGTMAGGAADCSFWIRKLRCEAAFHELSEGQRMSVARASRLLSHSLYENRHLGLSMGTMIMGFDDMDGENFGSRVAGPPKIYYVDDSGARVQGEMFAVGSGSTFALGILDRERRREMEVDEAIALGIKAIRHATFRDASSGGFINVYLITREGWRLVFSEDIATTTPDSFTTW